LGASPTAFPDTITVSSPAHIAVNPFKAVYTRANKPPPPIFRSNSLAVRSPVISQSRASVRSPPSAPFNLTPSYLYSLRTGKATTFDPFTKKKCMRPRPKGLLQLSHGIYPTTLPTPFSFRNKTNRSSN
jgi:hypothetical protein